MRISTVQGRRQRTTRLVDNAFLNNQNMSNPQLTGWQNGDFNYDGAVNGSDYTLIDNAFNSQGPSLGSNPLD
jgi:hypothetical protein